MALITFGFKDFLGEDLENNICRLTPTQPITSGSEVLVNSPLYLHDGDVVDLPLGVYTVRLSGSNTVIKGWMQITSTAPNNFSSLFNITTNPQDIPQSLPISAINGLKAELDGKLDRDDPLLNGILTPAQVAKLNSVQTGATQNSTDTFLVARENHTGTQPISSVTGLQSALDGKVDDAELTSVNSAITTLQTNQFTSAERTKLSGIQNNATQNQTDTFLLGRANHTGTQPISSVTGLQTALDGKANLADGITSAERTKLSGIQTGATLNSTDTQLRDRATHTGTQPISTITNLQTSLDGKANVADGITVAERNKLSGIQTGATVNSSDATLLNRTNHTGTQPISTVSGLQSALDGKQNLNNRLTSISSEPNPTQPLIPQLNTDGSLVFIPVISGEGTSGVSSFNGRTGSVIPQLSDYGSFFLQPETTPTLTGLNIRFNPTTTIPISSYQFSTTERGISVPLIRVTGGRIDFQHLDNKAEFRVTGTNTELGVYNIDTFTHYLRINSSGDSFIRRHLFTDGNIVAGSSNSGNHRLRIDGTARIDGAVTFNSSLSVSGLPLFSGGSVLINNSGSVTQLRTDGATTWFEINNQTTGTRYIQVSPEGDLYSTRDYWVGRNIVAGSSNPGNHRLFIDGNSRIQGNLEVTGQITSINQAYQSIGSAVPSTPTNGFRWLEKNGAIERSWVWDSALGVWISTEAFTSDVFFVQSVNTFPFNRHVLINCGFGSGVWVELMNVLVRAVQGNSSTQKLDITAQVITSDTALTYPGATTRSTETQPVNTTINYNLLPSDNRLPTRLLSYASNNQVGFTIVRTGTITPHLTAKMIYRVYR